MKHTIIGAAVLACLTLPAFAATTVWQGDLFITAISEASPGVSCNAVNMHVGDFARAVFRPKSVAGNGTSDLLSWHFARSSGQIVPSAPTTTTLNGATKATIRIIYGSAGFTQFSGATAATLTGTTVTPAAPTAGTPTVAISMTIVNAYSSNASTPSGCDTTINGTLAKRPI